MKHTLQDAIQLCRMLEKEAINTKENFHFALGGSCLMKGESNKDFDIYIYPHEGSFVEENSARQFMKKFGWKESPKTRREEYDIDKPFLVFKRNGYRVDLFFVDFQC